ncbi:MAG: hypothetical protein PVH82_11130 [Desulfobacteraceae bacterium]|jgi:hypothetical protein
MEHSDFITRCEGPDIFWGVKNFFRSVFRIWRPAKGILIVVVAAAIFSASIAYGLFLIFVGKPLSLIWLVLCLFGFLTGKPGLNGLELAFFVIVAVLGVVLSFVLGGHHVIGGLLPGISWFAMGVLKGSTMVAMQERLIESRALYENLRDDGTLFFRNV